MDEIVKKVKHVLEALDKDVTNDYVLGLYNGIEFANSIQEWRKPIYMTSEGLREINRDLIRKEMIIEGKNHDWIVKQDLAEKIQRMKE